MIDAFFVNRSGVQKKKPHILLIYKAFCFLSEFLSGPSGAENGTRTRDPQLGKLMLYQLSYFRICRKLSFLKKYLQKEFSIRQLQRYEISSFD